MKHEKTKSIPAATTHSLLDAELPARGGEPLVRLQIEIDNTPRGGGEDTHVRIHLQTSFGNAALPAVQPNSAEALSQSDGEARSRTRLPVRQVAAIVQRGFDNPLIKRMAAPLLRHDFNTWIDLRASTAPLMRGVGALMPRYADKLRQIGVQLPPGDAPLAHTWSGATGGVRPGFAQFSILRFDRRHLPAAAAALLGNRPFQVVAAVAQVVEERQD